MSRSKSILSTLVLLVGVVVLLGMSVHALRVWQAQDAVDGEFDRGERVVAAAADKPVRLWHEAPSSKPILAAQSLSSPDASPAKPRKDDKAGSRFAWVLTPKDPSQGTDSSGSSDAVAMADESKESPAEFTEEDQDARPTQSEFVTEGTEFQPSAAPPAASRLLLTSTDENAPPEIPDSADSDSADSDSADSDSADSDSAVSDSTGSDAEASASDAPATNDPELPPAGAAAAGAARAESGLVEPEAAAGPKAQEPAMRVKVGRTREGEPARTTTIQEAPLVDGLENSPAWPQAQALRATLASLANDPDGNAWASQVAAALEKLEAAPSFQSPESAAALRQLHDLSEAVRKQVSAEEVTPLHTKLLRANYALQRRLAIWQAIQSANAKAVVGPARPVNRQELAVATSALDAFLAASGRQQEWRAFLLMEDVVKTIRSPEDASSSSGRALARCILARLDSTLLTPQQAKFLDRPVVDRWTTLLQQWAVEPVEPAALLRIVERYESNPSTVSGRDIARVNQVLRWAPDNKMIDVGTQLNLHYRNANVRMAMAADLANRLLPPLRHFDAPVDDVIRNTRVVGRSQTSARSRLVLFPDRTRWSLGLDVLGSVASETQGQRGPAVFFQDGQARFHARKLVQVDHQGVHTKAAFAVAESSSQLTGLETDFDGVPLMNRLARSIAQKQYEGESNAAQSEVDERIANEASQRLDEEVRQLLADTQKKVETQVLRPLADLGLEPTPIDFETTRTRIIARYRLAGSHQLAAHSPRPQAPSNSLLSLQVHESALNNIIEQLRFDGRQVELPVLVRELAERLGRKDVALPEDLPENVQVQFANEDAVRVTFDAGRVTIALQVAELSQGRANRWKNFVVRAQYIPHIAGRQVELVRDGVIELGGDRQRIGDQVALRAIFAKVLSKNRPIPLLPTTLVDRRELSDVEASQAVVEDGWIGITLAQGGAIARQRSSQSQR